MSVQISYHGLECETTGGIVQYLIYTDGVDTWRKGVRSGEFVYDKVIGPLGFGVGSVENVDWEKVNYHAKP
jgi:hypothetical protein